MGGGVLQSGYSFLGAGPLRKDPCGLESNAGALIIGIGLWAFGVHYYYTIIIIRSPQNPILIINTKRYFS